MLRCELVLGLLCSVLFLLLVMVLWDPGFKTELAWSRTAEGEEDALLYCTKEDYVLLNEGFDLDKFVKKAGETQKEKRTLLVGDYKEAFRKLDDFLDNEECSQEWRRLTTMTSSDAFLNFIENHLKSDSQDCPEDNVLLNEGLKFNLYKFVNEAKAKSGREKQEFVNTFKSELQQALGIFIKNQECLDFWKDQFLDLYDYVDAAAKDAAAKDEDFHDYLGKVFSPLSVCKMKSFKFFTEISTFQKCPF